MLNTEKTYRVDFDEVIMLLFSGEKVDLIKEAGWKLFKGRYGSGEMKSVKDFSEEEALNYIIKKYHDSCDVCGYGYEINSIYDINTHNEVDHMITHLQDKMNSVQKYSTDDISLSPGEAIFVEKWLQHTDNGANTPAELLNDNFSCKAFQDFRELFDELSDARIKGYISSLEKKCILMIEDDRGYEYNPGFKREKLPDLYWINDSYLEKLPQDLSFSTLDEAIKMEVKPHLKEGDTIRIDYKNYKYYGQNHHTLEFVLRNWNDSNDVITINDLSVLIQGKNDYFDFKSTIEKKNTYIPAEMLAKFKSYQDKDADINGRHQEELERLGIDRYSKEASTLWNNKYKGEYTDLLNSFTESERNAFISMKSSDTKALKTQINSIASSAPEGISLKEAVESMPTTKLADLKFN